MDSDIRDIMRARLLVNVEAEKLWPGAELHTKPVPLKEVIGFQWSPEFEQLMKNRFVMGYYRYGSLPEQVASGNANNYDHIVSAKERIALYEDTHNMEHLVDVANMMLGEFELGDHPDRHFESIDDGTHL